MSVMSLDKWLKLTDAGLLRMRGATLERVDAALRRYHQTNSPADRTAVRTALDAYLQELGPDWKTHIRNQRMAISDLQRQLNGHLYIPDARELAALEALRGESRRLLEVLFRGKKVSWRNDGLSWLGNRRLEAGYDLAPGGASVVWEGEKLSRGDQSDFLKAEKWAADVFNEIVPVEFRALIKAALLSNFPNFMRQFAASVIPIVGLVTASGAFAVNMGRYARASYRVRQATKHSRQHINTGEPLMAIRAMVVILDRERGFDRAEAVVSSVEFGTKIAGMFLDLGTATNAIVGVSAKAAQLVNLLRVLVLDCYEMRAANVEIKLGRNLRKLFRICPLAGAYYVCCVPTSVLVNEILDRFWEGGWRGDVEYNVVNHIEPLREQARRVIAEHRFVIKGLERFPGVLSRNDAALAAMYKAFIENRQADPALGEGLI